MTPEQIAELEQDALEDRRSNRHFCNIEVNILLDLIATAKEAERLKEERDLLVKTLQYPEHKAAFRNLELQREVERLKAARDELHREASRMLEYVDHINPPTGPFWSGSLAQLQLRQALAKVQK